jgi:hypothetical protein
VNPHKTKLSFDLAQGAGGASAGTGLSSAGATAAVVPATLHRAASGAAFVKWCGLLINIANLEVQGDYTR